ncbi:hypothetical protein DBY73_003155 [Enterobacter sp. RIT418]|nr:hypothetical protein DBY73_003155 [Enterobacter sp. RIT 418]
MQPGVNIRFCCYRLKFQAKKNLRINAGWCKSCSSTGADSTYQYLWDLDSSNTLSTLATGQSQQPEAKCN